MPLFWIIIVLVGLLVVSSILYDSYSTTVPPVIATAAPSSVGPAWYDWALVEYLNVPLWVWIVGVVALLWLLSRLNLGSTFSVSFPSTGSVTAQIGISFLVLATFFYLLSKIYPNAPLFEPEEGYGHIAVYFLLSALIALVAANFKGKAWLVNTALVVLMFAMMGHRTADLLDPSGKLSTKIASVLPWNWGTGGRTSFASAPGRPKCSGIVQKATLNDSAALPLNPGGNCHIELHEVLPGQCAYVYDRWGTLLGDDCKTGRLNRDGLYGESFSAASGSLVPVTYVLCEHKGRLGIVADGCP